MSEVEKYIKSIPDFPQPGIIFRDVTSVTEDPEGMKLAIDEMDKLLEGVDYDVIAGPWRCLTILSMDRLL